MVLCLLSRGSCGHWTKLNHERRSDLKRIYTKSKILFKIQKKLQYLIFYKGAVNA